MRDNLDLALVDYFWHFLHRGALDSDKQLTLTVRVMKVAFGFDVLYR